MQTQTACPQSASSICYHFDIPELEVRVSPSKGSPFSHFHLPKNRPPALAELQTGSHQQISAKITGKSPAPAVGCHQRHVALGFVESEVFIDWPGFWWCNIVMCLSPCEKRKKKRPYFPVYWLVNREPYNGLLYIYIYNPLNCVVHFPYTRNNYLGFFQLTSVLTRVIPVWYSNPWIRTPLKHIITSLKLT